MKVLPYEFEPPALRRVGLKVAKVQGVNLAQGLCMLPVPSLVAEGARNAIASGGSKNWYSLAQGIPELREALARRLRGHLPPARGPCS